MSPEALGRHLDQWATIRQIQKPYIHHGRKPNRTSHKCDQKSTGLGNGNIWIRSPDHPNGHWNEPLETIQRNAFSVFFDEKFSIPLDPSALEENSLRFSVFGIDEDDRSISTGLADLKLSDLDLSNRAFNAWLYLQDVNKATDTVGEILLSLSYLPTAERLTVVVVKAKNLVWNNGKAMSDPFVKVYLLQDTRKISKKKTAVKRDDPNPVFNEAMIFSVPAIVLQELSLRITVAECSEDGRTENIGHVIIGPETSGMGGTHWNQMLATLRKPVSMWHALRKK
ncbi:hypothetical protein chiPu_0004513 [Chiloscyllium punctatum]|uniref:C2 domain-containing protein n=1 Tax=Chiloscyllium punctatum TaxID=137246 RepID=A0A401S6T3_CHIPU|nr:hypothetical protein [Chiloscyllium punctatum]